MVLYPKRLVTKRVNQKAYSVSNIKSLMQQMKDQPSYQSEQTDALTFSYLVELIKDIRQTILSKNLNFTYHITKLLFERQKL